MLLNSHCHCARSMLYRNNCKTVVSSRNRYETNLLLTLDFELCCRLTREWPRFKDELETIKFICTDFWSSIYKKQIDNLRTNNQGLYVLQDNHFRFISKISTSKQYLEVSPKVCVQLTAINISNQSKSLYKSIRFQGKGEKKGCSWLKSGHNSNSVFFANYW